MAIATKRAMATNGNNMGNGYGSRGSTVAARRQHGGSAAVAAWWWQWQLGGGGSGVAEAAVGDGRDEGGEVVMWRLFMFVIFLHISSVPVNRAEGSHIISVFV
jgi:hypothetical protein